ncbi:hypothetical protein V5799_006443 [Amblyomma americanum]|uniref:Peptidase S1 domain-containing protein n=1 Tax=Amblyomma americanum TaxID=6943 RepID=A0AAQ4DWD0_AMBAM
MLSPRGALQDTCTRSGTTGSEMAPTKLKSGLIYTHLTKAPTNAPTTAPTTITAWLLHLQNAVLFLRLTRESSEATRSNRTSGRGWLKAHNIIIRLGAHNIREWSVNVLDIQVSHIRQHPDFQMNTHMNDIAVLRLERPVTFNKYIRPVCLPERPVETYFSKTAVATGWGTLKFGGPSSNVLREVELIVWNNTDGNQRFTQPITEVFLCAGAKKREGDTCQGDSGGPLMVQTRPNQWTLIGVTSWGNGCGMRDFPGVYTRISHFLNYIENTPSVNGYWPISNHK